MTFTEEVAALLLWASLLTLVSLGPDCLPVSLMQHSRWWCSGAHLHLHQVTTYFLRGSFGVSSCPLTGASKHNLNSSDFELVRQNHNPWFFGVISALMFVRICTIDPSKWKFKQRKLQCLHNALPIAYSQEIIFGILSAETSCIVKGRMSLFCQIIPVLSNSL